MKAYVICKTGLYNAAKPTFTVPKLYMYMGNFEVKATGGGWCVVIVDESTEIPPAAEADPDIFVFNTQAELDATLTNQQRTRANSVLTTTPWGVTAVSGDTARTVLGKIRAAVGDTVESWGLGV